MSIITINNAAIAVTPSNIYITDEVNNTTDGTTDYNLHVEGSAFVGYVILTLARNTNTHAVTLSTPYGDVSLPGSEPANETYFFEPIPVNIPLTSGTPQGLFVTGSPYDSELETQSFGSMSFSPTPNYSDKVLTINVSHVELPI